MAISTFVGGFAVHLASGAQGRRLARMQLVPYGGALGVLLSGLPPLRVFAGKSTTASAQVSRDG